MITASVVTFHTSYVDLKRLLDCVLHSSIDIFLLLIIHPMIVCVSSLHFRTRLSTFIVII